MNKNKKIVLTVIIVLSVIILGIVTGIVISKKNNSKIATNSNDYSTTSNVNDKGAKQLNDNEKKIAGMDENAIIEEKEKIKKEETVLSEQYKEYLKLPEETKEKLDVIPRKEEVPIEKLDEIEEKFEEKYKEEDLKEIPEKFNLKDKIDIKVENQGEYGLCWDFASLKSLETYLALNNLGNYDFSELHLDYIESDLLYGNGRKLHSGGSFDIFKNYAVKSGVVLEENIPYNKNYTKEEYEKFIDMDNIVTVTEVVEFPSIYKSSPLKKYTQEDLKKFRDSVKKHIMKNGGVYTTVVGTGEKNSFVSSDEMSWTNHAVTIVGWDDNYSRNNFRSNTGKVPTQDGAYIALNSWGTFYNDGGYYYISYEDQFVETEMSGIVSTSIDDAYKISDIKNEAIRKHLENNYQHQFIEYNGEKYITKVAVSLINYVDLSNSNISNLDGIEIFSNVRDLDLSNNNIVDISELSKLKNIVEINLEGNKIKDVTPLANYENYIYKINLSNNNIKDVSSLAKLNIANLVLTGNNEIKGYGKLQNVYGLSLNNCNIRMLESFEKTDRLNSLNLSNNPYLSSKSKLPEELNFLDISNCNLNNLEIISNLRQLYELNVSSNKLTNLNDLPNFKEIISIKVSNNKINNWDKLKEIGITFNVPEINEYEEEYYEYEGKYFGYKYDGSITLEANNCNIKDISVFNDLKIRDLTLKDNNLEDISNLKNDVITTIDLSNNNNLKGFDSLKNIEVGNFENCGITNLNEILKLENIQSLNLKDNKIVDINDLSKLKNLVSLSLAGNKGLKGTLSNDLLFILNVSNCDLDDDFNITNLKELNNLIINENPKITKLSNIIKDNAEKMWGVECTEISLEEFEKIKEINPSIKIYSKVINCNQLVENNHNINFYNYTYLKKTFMTRLTQYPTQIKNGNINKNGYSFKIKNPNIKKIEITYVKNYDISEKNIVINFN